MCAQHSYYLMNDTKRLGQTIRLTSLTMVNFFKSGQVGLRIVNQAFSKSHDSVCANIYISGTASPRSQCLQTHDRGRDRTERILQAEEQILERVVEKPDISTRRLAAEVEVSQFVVHRTLKKLGLHPYHVQKVQTLQPTDFPCNLRRKIVIAMS